MLAHVEQLRNGGPRTVLLVGPDFTDRTVWDALLASPARQGPTDAGAHFDLRRPGIEPTTISLDDVTAVADYYTVELAPGDIDHGAAQLAHVADRLAALHPGPITVVAHSTAGLVARAYAAAHADRFGSSWFVLPNPLYGSWERALGVGAPEAESAEEKRARLLGRLRSFR